MAYTPSAMTKTRAMILMTAKKDWICAETTVLRPFRKMRAAETQMDTGVLHLMMYIYTLSFRYMHT